MALVDTKIITSAFIIILMIVIVSPGLVRPAIAAPVWTVDLDAHNTSATDVLVQQSYRPNSTFSVGAIVNASAINPISNIAGWQFGINYNSTLVVPQADPDPLSSYPDGSGSMITLGAQGTFGTYNWANAVAGGQAFSQFHIPPGGGTIFVFFAFFPPVTPVTLRAKTLLGSVTFELLNKTITPQAFTVSDVLFGDPNAQPIPGVIAGNNVTETILNDPPHARFTLTHISGYSFTTDGIASSDSDGTIADPGGYYWDWGDGTQNLTASSLILVHDYKVTCNPACPNGATLPGVFMVTLRVVDDKGATGSARDGQGGAIVNAQPSHRIQSILVDNPPGGTIAYAQTGPTPNANVDFTSNPTDPDGTVASTIWNFGDGSPRISGNTTAISHTYATVGNYIVTLTLTDNLGAAANVTQTAQVLAPRPPSVIVTAPTTGNAGTSISITVNASSPNPWSSVTTLKIEWGDGKIDTVTGASGTPSHSYSQAGTYTVTVTATDNSGNTTMKQSTIIVSPAPGLSTSLLLALVAIPIVAIAAFAIILLQRRKRGATPVKPNNP
ncbi:MAG: hypothetical protein AUJ07_10530 [Crenarchaeota archaeon 13_1_40CM_3_53_5]|nr:MAG: hypothetical protein AUJ07_10530 [Crenarchaeota archaeon 13_1_40CM_3_53_5]